MDAFQQPNEPEWDDLLFRKEEIPRQICKPFPGPLGQATLATRDELEDFNDRPVEKPGDYIRLLPGYGVSTDQNIVHFPTGLPLPAGSSSPNVLFIGRSGAKKTESGILPALFFVIAMLWTAFYVNLKGRRQTLKIARVAMQYGRNIVVLAPGDPYVSLGFNPLQYVSSIEDARRLTESILSSVVGNARFGESGWTFRTCADWMTHTIYILATRAEPETRTLVELRRIIVSADFKAFADKNSDVDVLASYAAYFASDNKNAETNLNTLREVTAFIDSAEAFLSASEFSVQDALVEGAVVVLEIAEHQVDTFQTIQNLFLEVCLGNINQIISKSETGKLARPTFIIMDELPTLGNVRALPRSLHTCRESDLRFVSAVQSIEQIRSIYGPDTATVTAGFQTKVVFGGGLDFESAEYFSKLSGQSTICIPSTLSRPVSSADEMLNEADGWQLCSRPLLLSSEIANPKPHPLLGSPATIFIGDGTTSPFRAWLTPCFEDGRLQRILSEHAQVTNESLRREKPLAAPPKCVAASTSKVAISDTVGWTETQLQERLATVERDIKVEEANSSAKKFWKAFKDERKATLVLRTAEELLVHEATLQEYFMTYVYSGVDNIQGNVYAMLLNRIKRREAEEKKRKKLQAPIVTSVPTGDAIVLSAVGTNRNALLLAVRELTGTQPTELLLKDLPSVLGYCQSETHAREALAMLRQAGATVHSDPKDETTDT
jgi:hypothetical protein